MFQIGDKVRLKQIHSVEGFITDATRMANGIWRFYIRNEKDNVIECRYDTELELVPEPRKDLRLVRMSDSHPPRVTVYALALGVETEDAYNTIGELHHDHVSGRVRLLRSGVAGDLSFLLN